MTTEINELFEEGVTGCRALADAADEAMNIVDATAKAAESLAQRVEDEGKEACQHMRELVSRLEQVEGELSACRGQAEGALEGLAARAGELKGEAARLLERVTKSIQELDPRKDRLDTALETDVASVQHEFQDLAQKTHGAGIHEQEQVQRAATTIAALRTAIETAREGLGHRQEAWTAAAQGLESAVHEQVTASVAGLQALLSRQAAAMVQMANAMVDQHNQAMAAIRHGFEEQAPRELAAALQPLEHALEHLGADAGQRGQALSSRAAELEQWTDQALPLLETIQAAVEAAARLA